MTARQRNAPYFGRGTPSSAALSCQVLLITLTSRAQLAATCLDLGQARARHRWVDATHMGPLNLRDAPAARASETSTSPTAQSTRPRPRTGSGFRFASRSKAAVLRRPFWLADEEERRAACLWARRSPWSRSKGW